MNTIPSLKLKKTRLQTFIREALDAVDPSEVKNRVLIALAIGGGIEVAIWFDAGLRKSAASNNAIIIRAAPIILSTLTVTAVKLRNEMKRNTRTILRAIAEFDFKSMRNS